MAILLLGMSLSKPAAPAAPAGNDEGLVASLQKFVSTPAGQASLALTAVGVAALGYFAYRAMSTPSAATPAAPVKKTVSSSGEKKAGGAKKSTGAKKSASPAAATASDTAAAAKPLSEPTATSPAAASSEDDATAASDKPLEKMTKEERIEAAKNAKARGNKYFQGQQYEKAIELYTEAIRVSPVEDTQSLSVFYGNRAACYANKNMLSEVIDDCTTALKYDNKYVKALYRRATTYQAQNELKKALVDLMTVCLLEDFSNHKVTADSDLVLRKIGQNEAAERMKGRKTKLPSYYFITAYITSFHSKDYLNPPEITNESTKEADELYVASLNLIKDSKYDEALSSLDQAIEKKTSFLAPALNWRGTFLYLKGELDHALSDFNASISLDPLNTNSLIKRGSIYMEKSDPTGALEDFQHAIELEPESADIFYHRGQVHFLMGNLEDAAKDYEKSISLNSTIAFAYIQLGVAMYRIGNHKDAISQFKKAEQKFPESHDVFNYFGEILLDQSQFDEALQKFERAMTLAPKNPLAYINKGLLLFQYNKDTQAAMDHIKQAIAVDDRCDIAYAHMAQLLLTQKHIKGAIENYEHAIELARTEVEMANVISMREAASANLAAAKYLGLPIVEQD